MSLAEFQYGCTVLSHEFEPFEVLVKETREVVQLETMK